MYFFPKGDGKRVQVLLELSIEASSFFIVGLGDKDVAKQEPHEYPSFSQYGRHSTWYKCYSNCNIFYHPRYFIEVNGSNFKFCTFSCLNLQFESMYLLLLIFIESLLELHQTNWHDAYLILQYPNLLSYIVHKAQDPRVLCVFSPRIKISNSHAL